jgi:hypothetical protein
VIDAGSGAAELCEELTCTKSNRGCPLTEVSTTVKLPVPAPNPEIETGRSTPEPGNAAVSEAMTVLLPPATSCTRYVAANPLCVPTHRFSW